MAAKDKNKTEYICSACSAVAAKWSGKCESCGKWNTIEEKTAGVALKPAVGRLGFAAAGSSKLILLDDAETKFNTRIPTGLAELDRVLGSEVDPLTGVVLSSGLVAGSAVLLGGPPGAGKSTLLLQAGCLGARSIKVVYFAGEETLSPILSRKKRLGFGTDSMLAMAESNVLVIADVLEREHTDLAIVDSIQTMYHPEIDSLPGSPTQIKSSANVLVNTIRGLGTALVLVGHVTKEDDFAGPRVLEHLVDATLMLSANMDSRYRILRSKKNRFGNTSEIGVFAMTESGLKTVENPSAIFLSRAIEDAPGSVATAVWEGTRPIFVEVQALVDQAHGNPRRVAVGMDDRRLAMLLAILNKHSGIQIDESPLSVGDQDVYANIVGGVKVEETSADLAILLATASSLLAKTIPSDVVAFGEVGLIGEVRPSSNGADRIREAAKLGFKSAVVPVGNVGKERFRGIEVYPVATLYHALDWLNNLR